MASWILFHCSSVIVGARVTTGVSLHPILAQECWSCLDGGPAVGTLSVARCLLCFLACCLWPPAVGVLSPRMPCCSCVALVLLVALKSVGLVLIVSLLYPERDGQTEDEQRTNGE